MQTILHKLSRTTSQEQAGIRALKHNTRSLVSGGGVDFSAEQRSEISKTVPLYILFILCSNREFYWDPLV
jgi:hypothetical protein